MLFTYTVYAARSGAEGTTWYQFGNDLLLSLGQIKFVVHCRMLDAGIQGTEVEILRMDITGVAE